MRWLIVIALMTLFVPASSLAQGGLIGLYVDPWGGVCDIEDLTVDVIDVYVVHKLAPAATAGQFAIQASSGFTGTYLGEELPAGIPIGAGNSQRGIAIAYGACYSSPIHILTIRYLLWGTSAPNSYLEVVADPGARPTPGIWMCDCAMPPLEHPAHGGRAYINGDGSASCTTTPVEPTTWGRVKSLYQD